MIELACSADAKYLPHVSAMLHSALLHTQGQPVRVWLLHGGELPADGVEKVEKVVQDFGGQLELLPVADDLMVGFPTAKFHYSCWYRILLADLLPDLDRILYLDCDIIVTDDLEPLWQTDLEGRIFGGCVNPLYGPMKRAVRDMGITEHLDYLNSGVLLLDLPKMREANLSERLREYAVDHPDNACPEQDALSVVFRGQWKRLHPRWNVQTALFDLPPRKLPHTEAEVKEAVNVPAVIHFNGPFKPWHVHCTHSLRSLYFTHLRSTPWPEEPLGYDTWAFRLLRRFSVSTQYRVLLYVRPRYQALRQRLRSVRGGAPAGAPTS